MRQVHGVAPGCIAQGLIRISHVFNLIIIYKIIHKVLFEYDIAFSNAYYLIFTLKMTGREEICKN